MLVSVEGELSSYTTKATYGQIEETKTPKKTRPMSTPVPIRPTRPNRPGSLVLNDAGSSGGYIYSIGGSGSNRPGSNRNSLVGGVGSLLNGNNFNSSVNYAATGAGAASPNVSTPPSAMPAMSPNGGGMTRARSRSASSPLPADVPPSALSRPLVLHPDFRRDGDVVLVCSDMGELVGFRVNGSMLRMASPILAALVKDKRGTASRPHFVKVTDSPDDMHAFLRLLRFGTPAVVPLPPAPASPAPTEPELSADGHTEEAEAETETETEVTASSSGETTDGEAVTASEMESNAGGVDSGDEAPPPPAPRVASPAPRDTSSPDPRIASPAPRMSTPSLTAPLATSPSPTPHTPVGASGTAPGVPPDFFPTVAQYDGIQRLALKYNGWYPRAVLDFHVELRAPEIVARVGKHGSRADVFALVRLAHTLHSSFLWAEICDRLRTGWWHEILNPWKLGDEDVAVIGDSVFSLLSILASVSSRPNLFSHLDELCVMYSEDGDVSVAATERRSIHQCCNCFK